MLTSIDLINPVEFFTGFFVSNLVLKLLDEIPIQHKFQTQITGLPIKTLFFYHVDLFICFF